MRADELWAYLGGYVRIRVTGPAVERFVNLVSARGHRLWRTRRLRRALEGNVTVAAFRRLRPAARRTRSRVRILRRHGLPFALRRLGRRPVLAVGALVSLALLYALSMTIWTVEIEGAERLEPGLLLEVLANLGVRPGVLKTSIDPKAVERGLLLSVHGLSWAAVEMHGTTVLVRVVEKNPLERPEVPVPPVDIVAAKDGVITTLIVMAGRPVHQEGDTVKAGEIVIQGSQPGAVRAGESKSGVKPPPPEVPVVAAGIVRARVWYQAYAEAALHTLSHEPTGRVWRKVNVMVARHQVPLIGWWERPVGLYERAERHLGLPIWRSIGVPVEIVTTIFTEVRDVRRDLTPEEAEQAAEQAAAAELARRLPQGVRPVSYHFEVTRKSDILIGVLATAETIEDIAQTRQR